MFYPVVCFEKQALTAEATNPLTSLWRSLTCALTAFHSCYLIDLHTINTPFCCIFKATAASLVQTSTAFFVSVCESLQMFYSGSFPWNCPTWVFLPSCTPVYTCYGSFLPPVFTNYKLYRFPHGDSVSSLHIYSVHVCMCEGGCVRLPVGPDVGCVCVQCVNLGLVGLLRHDPDYVGPCLQQCYPPQPWPANLTNKDLGHTHPHRINTEFVNHLWGVKCAT